MYFGIYVHNEALSLNYCILIDTILELNLPTSAIYIKEKKDVMGWKKDVMGWICCWTEGY